jgi:hypothetical protein
LIPGEERRGEEKGEEKIENPKERKKERKKDAQPAAGAGGGKAFESWEEKKKIEIWPVCYYGRQIDR